MSLEKGCQKIRKGCQKAVKQECWKKKPKRIIFGLRASANSLPWFDSLSSKARVDSYVQIKLNAATGRYFLKVLATKKDKNVRRCVKDMSEQDVKRYVSTGCQKICQKRMSENKSEKGCQKICQKECQ